MIIKLCDECVIDSPASSGFVWIYCAFIIDSDNSGLGCHEGNILFYSVKNLNITELLFDILRGYITMGLSLPNRI